MNKSSYANRLMTELPFTQNQEIKGKLLRASELKELGKFYFFTFLSIIFSHFLEKLNQIQHEN